MEKSIEEMLESLLEKKSDPPGEPACPNCRKDLCTCSENPADVEACDALFRLILFMKTCQKLPAPKARKKLIDTIKASPTIHSLFRQMLQEVSTAGVRGQPEPLPPSSSGTPTIGLG